MTFDWTVNIGGVLALVALLVTMVRLHRSNVERITRIETKVDMLYQWWTGRGRDQR